VSKKLVRNFISTKILNIFEDDQNIAATGTADFQMQTHAQKMHPRKTKKRIRFFWQSF